MLKSEDLEYNDHILEAVTPGNGGWQIHFDGATCFWVPTGSVEPHTGDTARFYGRGLGSIVRGLDINGQEVFYRTPEQQEEHARQERIASDIERKRVFAKAKSRLDLEYDNLPTVFQKRLDGFRQTNPDFRWEMEAYEMSVCKDAVRIAETLKTADAIQSFHNLNWDEQKKAVPGLFDGHSGNSFGAACQLAHIYLTDSKLIPLAHGALCPLVGCKSYGCAVGR